MEEERKGKGCNNDEVEVNVADDEEEHGLKFEDRLSEEDMGVFRRLA